MNASSITMLKSGRTAAGIVRTPRFRVSASPSAPTRLMKEDGENVSKPAMAGSQTSAQSVRTGFIAVQSSSHSRQEEQGCTTGACERQEFTHASAEHWVGHIPGGKVMPAIRQYAGQEAQERDSGAWQAGETGGGEEWRQ